jgi:hypothetical protein
VLREHDERRFSLTTMGNYLRNDIAGTQAPIAIMIGGASFWPSGGNLLHAVRRRRRLRSRPWTQRVDLSGRSS